jgi:hypothetical protein
MDFAVVPLPEGLSTTPKVHAKDLDVAQLAPSRCCGRDV